MGVWYCRPCLSAFSAKGGSCQESGLRAAAARLVNTVTIQRGNSVESAFLLASVLKSQIDGAYDGGAHDVSAKKACRW